MFSPFNPWPASQSEPLKMTRNVHSQPPTSTSAFLTFPYMREHLNFTNFKDGVGKEMSHDDGLLALPSKSKGAIHKRQILHNYMTRWALSHPLCATNVTSYVGQTARMHCCLARLERDLSVTFLYSYFGVSFSIVIWFLKGHYYCRRINIRTI